MSKIVYGIKQHLNSYILLPYDTFDVIRRTYMIEVFELLSKIFSITIPQHSCNFRNIVLLGGQQFKRLSHFERIDIIFRRIPGYLSYPAIKSSTAHSYIDA